MYIENVNPGSQTMNPYYIHYSTNKCVMLAAQYIYA